MESLDNFYANCRELTTEDSTVGAGFMPARAALGDYGRG